ncbi:hypothetical protein [Bordetella genomosp. 13]|uniref:Haemolysin-type calcium binding-related domain-containing protein n=1 Tax=Bordetella genomosp. 13 TaxID=463040 RepID=A0A1W6ZEC3_9BORD|nr:hypothetical protein [Bordetella genomosp. 13]ARP95723.1 hypothetical protein CAL15_15875 [Bordetella genomosp. 13]
MAGVQYPLQASDVAILDNHVKNENYVAAYGYIRNVIEAGLESQLDAANRENLESLATWYNIAWHVNQNDGSFWSEYVRGATQRVAEIHGSTLSETAFNAASNRLAGTLLSEIVRTGTLLSPEDTVRADAQNMQQEFGVPPWTWPGTFFDWVPSGMGGLGGDYVGFRGESLADYLHAYGIALQGIDAGTARVAGQVLVDVQTAISDGFVDGLLGLRAALEAFNSGDGAMLGFDLGSAGSLTVDLFQRGTTFSVDPGKLTSIGLDDKGQLTFGLTLSDRQGDWGPSLVCLPDGTTTATVLGRGVLDIAPGASIRVDGQSLSIALGEGALSGECVVQRDSLAVSWSSSSTDFAFSYTIDLIDSSVIYQIRSDGKIYSGTADNIGEVLGNAIQTEVLGLAPGENASLLQIIGRQLGVAPEGYDTLIDNLLAVLAGHGRSQLCRPFAVNRPHRLARRPFYSRTTARDHTASTRHECP